MTLQVTTGYFRTLTIPILRGRDLDERDGAGKIVVAESTARLFWPGEDPIGKRLSFAEGKKRGDLRSVEVVGVAVNVRKNVSDRVPLPLLYTSFAARPTAYLAKTGDADRFLASGPKIGTKPQATCACANRSASLVFRK